MVLHMNLDKIQRFIIQTYKEINNDDMCENNSCSQLLNQEQEKEYERETQIELPLLQQPRRPKKSYHIQQLVLQHIFRRDQFDRVDKKFRYLYMSKEYEYVCLKQDLQQSNYVNYFQYTRPVNWVLIAWDYKVGILLSPFEVNWLKTHISVTKYNITLHCMCSRINNHQKLLFDNIEVCIGSTNKLVFDSEIGNNVIRREFVF